MHDATAVVAGFHAAPPPPPPPPPPLDGTPPATVLQPWPRPAGSTDVFRRPRAVADGARCAFPLCGNPARRACPACLSHPARRDGAGAACGGRGRILLPPGATAARERCVAREAAPGGDGPGHAGG